MDGMVAAGKIGGLFGGKGELTLILYDHFPRDPNPEEPVFVTIDGHTVPLFFERFARRGVRGATVVFADIDTPVRASELVGREFFIRPGGRTFSDTTDPGELYFEDLVGWEAIVGESASGSETGSTPLLTGRITAFFDSEMNPLFEIEIDGAAELIPAQEDFIRDIDEERRRVVFDLPEGLLELNK